MLRARRRVERLHLQASFLRDRGPTTRTFELNAPRSRIEPVTTVAERRCKKMASSCHFARKADGTSYKTCETCRTRLKLRPSRTQEA